LLASPAAAGGIVPLDRAVWVHCYDVGGERPAALHVCEYRIRRPCDAQAAEGSAAPVLVNAALCELRMSDSFFL